MNKFNIIISFLLLIKSGNSANILFHFALSSYSHRISVWPLVESLADRGHNVTFLSPYPSKAPHPKVHEFAPEALTVFFKAIAGSMLVNRLEGKHGDLWHNLHDMSLSVCEILVKGEETKVWLKNSRFDLIVLGAFHNECGLGLGYYFEAKVINFVTSTPYMWMNDLMGHVPETSWISDVRLSYQQPMTFLQRVWNTLCPLYYQFYVKESLYFPQMENLLRTELEMASMPGLSELETRVSLNLVNTHYSMDNARSLPPAYVAVGGLQIVDTGNHTLPEDFEKFINESGEDGVIYVSFGSFAEVSTFPLELRRIFYNVIKSFPNIKFIWKSDLEREPDSPTNIFNAKWTPQANILAHKSVKAFITHGGLLSLHEAIYYGVPIIVFPMFADQDYNANLVERSGGGIKLEVSSVTKEVLRNAISEMMSNGRYKTQMAKESRAFRDRPASPLQTAIWWTEYVLRHQDVSFLKPLGRNQTWYQTRLLDVWIFIGVIITVIAAMVTYICAYFCLRLFGYSYQGKKIKKN